jgi:hypothetical protein
VRNADDRRFGGSIEISGYRWELSRMELGMKRAFLDLLRDGPRTVPEIAGELGITEHEAMWWMMGFVRYGYVTVSERANEDGYFTYRAAEGKEP